MKQESQISPFEVLIEDAQRVLQNADAEGSRFQHNSLDTGHLLIGYLRCATPPESIFLAKRGLSSEPARQVLGHAVELGMLSTNMVASPSLTEAAKKALQASVLYSQGGTLHMQDRVTADDIFKGVLRTKAGTSSLILQTLGADEDELYADFMRFQEDKYKPKEVKKERSPRSLLFDRLSALMDTDPTRELEIIGALNGFLDVIDSYKKPYDSLIRRGATRRIQ